MAICSRTCSSQEPEINKYISQKWLMILRSCSYRSGILNQLYHSPGWFLNFVYTQEPIPVVGWYWYYISISLCLSKNVLFYAKYTLIFLALPNNCFKQVLFSNPTENMWYYVAGKKKCVLTGSLGFQVQRFSIWQWNYCKIVGKSESCVHIILDLCFLNKFRVIISRICYWNRTVRRFNCLPRCQSQNIWHLSRYHFVLVSNIPSILNIMPLKFTKTNNEV